MTKLPPFRLDPSLEEPIYKQLAAQLANFMDRNVLQPGERLPATRELAGQLGLNRTTVSAAYAVLERDGRIDGHVGRGSFVTGSSASRFISATHAAPAGPISFATSRPPADEFPLDEFRRLAKEVIDSSEAGEMLQLGSALGYLPLRRFLLTEAIRNGNACSEDDILITNGCQQALDLIAREFAAAGTPVALEDPAYPGMLRAFSRTGAELLGVPVDPFGIEPDALERVLERRRPAILAVTPNFQNPTGVTLPLERRQVIADLAARYGCLLIEVDVYTSLRYSGAPLPALKSLARGPALLLGSYSKVSFPGLRVGWIVGPRTTIARLGEAKEVSDLHSDQLSQAILLRFAQSGGLSRHIARSCASGGERLQAVLSACDRHLPPGATWTRPEGGMNVWVELPPPLDADEVLRTAAQRGVSFITGRHFSTRNAHKRALRLSFGSLLPEQIERGIRVLGEVATEQLQAACSPGEELTPALV